MISDPSTASPTCSLTELAGKFNRWDDMIRLTHKSRILLAIAPADFRAGIDGMSARCRQVLANQVGIGSDA